MKLIYKISIFVLAFIVSFQVPRKAFAASYITYVADTIPQKKEVVKEKGAKKNEKGIKKVPKARKQGVPQMVKPKIKGRPVKIIKPKINSRGVGK